MINLQPTSAMDIFAVLSKCGFHHHHFQSQPQSFFCNNLFIWRINVEFWYKCIHHCTADVFIYRRRPAPVRYVTTQEKILKNRPVPGRLSSSPVMCKSLKSFDVIFICDHSIRNTLENFNEYSGLKGFLNDLYSQSRTVKFWEDCLIRLVLLLLMFVCAENEAEWPLHPEAIERMLP